MIRIGNGIDVHRFESGRNLILGGVVIPHDKGLIGHSDADVLVHAVMDALLGSLSLGDIGKWFPDNDMKYKNADSIQLLKEILNDEKLSPWKLVNLDSTIIAEKPRLSEYINDMRQNIANAFHCSIDRISVKATTTEKLGFCGKEEGITAIVTLLISNN